MKYRGYCIERAEKRLPNGGKIHGFGIYANSQMLSIAQDTIVAKRAVDAHTKSGIWPTLEEDQDEQQQHQ